MIKLIKNYLIFLIILYYFIHKNSFLILFHQIIVTFVLNLNFLFINFELIHFNNYINQHL